MTPQTEMDRLARHARDTAAARRAVEGSLIGAGVLGVNALDAAAEAAAMAVRAAALTGGDKTKTVDLGTGVLKWRFRPPSVRILKAEDVIARLKALALGRFVRTKEEVDKEAMLKEPQVARTVAGVSIGSGGEDFIVEPFEAELAAEPANAGSEVVS